MPNISSPRDNNRVPALVAISNSDQVTPVNPWVDPSTHRLLVDSLASGTTGNKTNNAAVPGATNLGVLPAVANAAAPTYTEAFQVALSTDLAGNLRTTTALAANSSVNVAQINGVTPLMGSGIMGTGSARVTIASDNDPLIVKQATAGNLNATVVGTGTFAVQATPVTQADTFMLGGVNIKEINAVAPLMGNGITGTGSQRVTIASDNTAFSVNATLSAETTKVIGTINIASAQTLATVTTVSTVTSLTQFGGTNIVTAGVAGMLAVGGNTATNVALTANPINNGAQGVSSENAVVTTGRGVQLVADLVGKLIVLPYANPENFTSGVTAAIVDTTNTSVIAAQGAGVRTYITSILVTNSHATVSTLVEIRDGATTVIWRGYALAAGGGFSVSFNAPLRGTANTAVTASCITTGSNVYVSIAGYKGV